MSGATETVASPVTVTSRSAARSDNGAKATATTKAQNSRIMILVLASS